MKKLFIGFMLYLVMIGLGATSSYQGTPRNTNGSKWDGWLVLPGEVFSHPTQYTFHDDIDFTGHLSGTDSSAVRITIPQHTAASNEHYQICYGSFWDPYHDSHYVNIPVQQDEQVVLRLSQPGVRWAFGFLYIIKISIDENDVASIVHTDTPISLDIQHVQCDTVCDLRIKSIKPAFHPNWFFYTKSGSIIESSSEGCNLMVEYFGSRPIKVKTTVSYQHQAPCPPIITTAMVKDSVTTHYELLNYGSVCIPQEAFSMPFQRGTFTITVTPVWEAPGLNDACYVEVEFPYYGENFYPPNSDVSNNILTIEKSWSYRDYIPSMKEAILVITGTPHFHNPLNGLLGVEDDLTTYLPANVNNEVLFQLLNKSIVPAYHLQYRFSMSKRNLDPLNTDEFGKIRLWRDFDYGDGNHSTPPNNDAVSAGNLGGGDRDTLMLTIRHSRYTEDYKRIWDIDPSEWQIDLHVKYYNLDLDGTLQERNLILEGLNVIFLEDVKLSNYGYPMDRDNEVNNISHSTSFEPNFYNCSSEVNSDNRFLGAYGECRGSIFKKLHTGVDIPSTGVINKNRLVFNVARGHIMYFDDLSGNVINNEVNVKMGVDSPAKHIYRHVQWSDLWGASATQTISEMTYEYIGYLRNTFNNTYRNSGIPLAITQYIPSSHVVDGHLHFEEIQASGKTINPLRKDGFGKSDHTLAYDPHPPIVDRHGIIISDARTSLELAKSHDLNDSPIPVNYINLEEHPHLKVVASITDSMFGGGHNQGHNGLYKVEYYIDRLVPDVGWQHFWPSQGQARKESFRFYENIQPDWAIFLHPLYDLDGNTFVLTTSLDYSNNNQEAPRHYYLDNNVFTRNGQYMLIVKAYDINEQHSPGNSSFGSWWVQFEIAGPGEQLEGHLSSNTSIHGKVYIDNDLTIINGAQLLIAPGTDILVAPGCKIVLENGSLSAIGTKDDPITFHTENDSTFWGGIRSVGDSTRIDLKHVVMKNAENYDEVFASNGGAIHIGATEHVNIQDTEFHNCRSNLGGAIYVACDSVNVINSKFYNNTAVEGGAVCVDSVMTNIVGSYFSGNHADNGSAISVRSSNANIINCSMLGNIPSEGGNTLAFNYSNARVVNSILWDNKDSLSDYQIYLQNGSSPSFYNCNIEDGLASIHGNSYQGIYSSNISSPPGYVEDPEFAYLLDPQSPCINAGSTNNIGLGLLPESDVEGNPRIDLGSYLIDIGAYELPASASVVTWNQDITMNTIWSSEIIHVTNSITVQDSVTLIINPGTKVIMDNGVAINVFGTVKSLGTETNHVVFTGPDSTPGFARISLYGYSASDSSRYMLLRSQASSTFSPNIIAGNDPKYSMKSIFLYSDFIVNPNAISADSLIGVQVQIDGVDDVSFNICQFSGTRGGASGGALSIHQSSVSVNDCTFMNTGGTQGGGIGAETSHVSLNYSLFTQSEANKGGALFAKDSYVNIQNSIFDFNVASDGGAIYADASLFCLVNNTIINNFANLGGGIYICEGSDFRALNTILYDNSAVEGSQAFIDTEILSFTPEFPEEWGNVDFQYCDIEGGVLGFAYADSNSSRNPGTRQIPIVEREREPKKHVMAKSNTVDDFNNMDSPPRLSEDYSLTYMSPCLDSGCYEGYAFDYNQINAEYLGYAPTGEAYDMGAKELGIVPLIELSGSIDSDAFILADVIRIVGNLTICDSASVVIDSTTTVIEIAGDYGIQVLGSLTVNGTQLVNTTISSTSGTTSWKGITVSDNGILRLTNCNVSNVICDTQGAIRGVDNACIHIDGCIIHNNIALSSSGGAVCIEGTGNYTNARLYIGDSTFFSNEAGKGGAVYIGISKTALIEGSQLYQNTSGLGGAIAIQDSTTIRNCEITRNEATLNGGGVYTNGIGLLFLNNLVTQNHAQGLGGGLCFNNDSPNIERTFVMNSIILGNTCDADSTNDIFGLKPGVGSSRQYVHCRIGDFSNCKYTIANSVSDIDPQFIDPENGGFGLSYYSSCIDGGAPIPYYLDSFGRWLQAEDINKTMCGDNYDIGSREYTDPQLIEISPDVLNYGDIAIGDVVSLTLEIKNHCTTQPLQISEIMLPPGFCFDVSKNVHVAYGGNYVVSPERQLPTFDNSTRTSKDINRARSDKGSNLDSIVPAKSISFPLVINPLAYAQISIVFQPQNELDYNGIVAVYNSFYPDPAYRYITAKGFDDTQFIEQDTVWNNDIVNINTSIHVGYGVTLSIAENTQVIFAKDRKLTIDHGSLIIADSVSFRASPQFVQAGIYLISSDETAFNYIKMSNCRLISNFTPLTILYAQIDSSYISQTNQNIQVSKSNFHYSHMNISTTALARSSYASITDNHFNYSPFSSLISLNSIDQYDISDNYMANYQTALLLNESGHGALHQIFNNVIEYNQYGYGIEIYHSNANIINSNSIRNNFIGIAGIRNSNIMIQGNVSPPYQSIHNNIDAELVFAEDSVPSVFKNNFVFDQLYGNNYLYKVVHHNSDRVYEIGDNYWGEPFDPNTAFYPLEYLNFEPVWFVGYDLSEYYNTVEELFLLANYNLEIGNYLLSYDQFMQVIEMETDDEDKKYKEYAAEMLLSVAELVEQPYSALQQYYLNEPRLHINTEISRLADYLANYCSIKMGNYPAAISWFEGIIANPPSERDSIYAFIDIAYTYMLMEGDCKHRDFVGRYPQCKFERFEDYVLARETLIQHLLTLTPSDNPPTPVFHTTLENNFPNPFNPSTTIRYSLESDTSCSIEIYNIKGQKVRVLFNNNQAKGQHSVVWDGKDQHGRPVSSGVYFYRLSTPKKSLTNKMLLLK
jgi:tetratricopeptide (TPR) repeat protein